MTTNAEDARNAAASLLEASEEAHVRSIIAFELTLMSCLTQFYPFCAQKTRETLMELSQNDFCGWHTEHQPAEDAIENKRRAYIESRGPKAAIAEVEDAKTEG